jgi:hypothetical protein
MTERHMFTKEEKAFFREYSYGHSRKETQAEFERRFGLALNINQITRQIKMAGGTGPYIYKVRNDNLTEKLHQNGTGEAEYRIKVNGKWLRKHRYIWEQAYGKIPPGKALLYKDGNRLNCTLENLVLVDKAVIIEMSRLDYHRRKGTIHESSIYISMLEVAQRSKKNENRKGQEKDKRDIDQN